MLRIIGSMGLGRLYLYSNKSLGQSLRREFPVAKCGSSIEDNGKLTSVIDTKGSGSTESANSVSLKYQN